jgi:hypothetical protein
VSTRRRAFLPSVDERLEPRIALASQFSAAVKGSFTPPATFGGGQIDPAIPYLNPFLGPNDPKAANPYQGISIAFNFTSGAFYSVWVTGFHGVPGLKTAVARYSATGNLGTFYTQLSLLSGHVPYGVKSGGLLYAWTLGLYMTGRMPAGAKLNGPPPTQPAPPASAFTNAQVGILIEGTLLQYLQNGIGVLFNVIKSSGHHPTDNLLTFNGKV